MFIFNYWALPRVEIYHVHSKDLSHLPYTPLSVFSCISNISSKVVYACICIRAWPVFENSPYFMDPLVRENRSSVIVLLSYNSMHNFLFLVMTAHISIVFGFKIKIIYSLFYFPLVHVFGH